ncbi:MAG: hypothetical protein HW421_734 [Ignavibacteria bacterium]|nr:hypothetical protein [Ignavibacteria bacterium]
MLTKENIITTINGLQEPIILDDVLERIFLLEKIERGIEQSKNEQVISDVEMDKRIESWLI